jgi:hypothetical protein
MHKFTEKTAQSLTKTLLFFFKYKQNGTYKPQQALPVHMISQRAVEVFSCAWHQRLEEAPTIVGFTTPVPLSEVHKVTHTWTNHILQQIHDSYLPSLWLKQ